jgi:PAS domain S-box-containing protein
MDTWFSQIFNENPNPCWVFDLKTLKFRAVNKSCIDKYGYSKEELLNDMTIMDIRPLAEAELFISERKKIDTTSTYTGTWKHIKKNKEIFYVEIYAHPITYKGKACRFVMAVDVDKRIKTEQKNRELSYTIKETAAKFEEIFNGITDAFFSLDFDYKFTFINEACEALYKRKRSDVVGKSVWEQFPLAIGTKFETEMKKAMTERTVVEFEEFSQTPQLWIYAKIYPIRDGIAAYFRNINEEKKLVERLRQEELNRKSMVNNITDAIWAIDRDMKLISFNHAYSMVIFQMFGRMPELGDAAININYDTATNKRWIEHYRKALSGIQFQVLEQAILAGKTHYIDCSFCPILGIDGQIAGITCTAKDVTEDHERIERIKKQNEKLKQIAWIQSHKIRGPLASIMGLLELIDTNDASAENNKIALQHLSQAARQLDAVIHEINDHTRTGESAPVAEAIH